jgi:Domain of unknown function (DUF4260)
MTSASSLLAENPVVAPPVLWWLRLEGLAVAMLAAVLYARIGASWWLFAALWLVPDLSMIGYLAGPRLGANCYNAIHSYLLPIVLAIAALSFQRAALPFVLIWFNHIGVDRLLGYGLKYPTAFGHTHLTEPRRLQAPMQHVPPR